MHVESLVHRLPLPPAFRERESALVQWLGYSRIAYTVDERFKVLATGELFMADMSYSPIKTDNKTRLKEVPPETLHSTAYRRPPASATA